MKLAESVELLNRLIVDATKSRNNPLDLLAEHLNAAKRYLLASSSLEYRLSLLEATKSLYCIAEKSDRRRIAASIKSLEYQTK